MVRPARRRSRRAFVAPFVAACVALSPLITAASPVVAASTTTNFTTNAIQVTISRITPIAPQPGDTLVVAGTLHNTTDAPIGDLLYDLKMGTSFIGYRGLFDSYADDQDGDLDTTMGAITLPIPAHSPTLEAGQSERFRITVSVDSLNLGTIPQVRALGVSVSSGSTPEGRIRTFLPWAPRTATYPTPTPVAWVWPLVDRPHRTTGATGTTWTDDDLAPELAPVSATRPGGRLAQLLNAGAAAESQHAPAKHGTTQQVPVTWAIDPMLLSEIKAMTTPYKVTTPDGSVDGAGTGVAKTFLPALHAALTRPDAEVLALPYADPDVVAAVRAGFTSLLGAATTTGRDLLEQFAGRSALDFGWPAGGFADVRTLNTLSAIGNTSEILSTAAVPPIEAPSATPQSHTTITTSDGQIDTLLSDSVLDTAVNDGTDNPDGWRVSLQRYLAETLMIYAESPNIPRAVVIAPNRRWTPDASYAAALLADTGKVPWIAPVSLADVQQTAPDTTTQRVPLTYPEPAKHNELPASYLARVKTLSRSLSDFAAIQSSSASSETAATRSYASAEQQALSSAWRSDHDLASSQLGTLQTAVAKLMNQVRITTIGGSHITLTSHGGKVPVTVANNLDVPVTVVVTVPKNQRLTLSGGGTETVSLPAHQQTRVDLHADAKTSGLFPIKVQLQTPGPRGHNYGQPVRLYIRSTVYGTITLVITGAATAALMVAVAIRLTRRALKARRSAATPAT